jgi:hypothetical protein
MKRQTYLLTSLWGTADRVRISPEIGTSEMVMVRGLHVDGGIWDIEV